MQKFWNAFVEGLGIFMAGVVAMLVLTLSLQCLMATGLVAVAAA